MMNQMNQLPVPTWNRTGVNKLDQKASLPEREFEPGSRVAYNEKLPTGISLMDDLPEELAAIPNGMGEALDQFVRSGADKTCYLLATEPVKDPVVVNQVLDLNTPVLRTHFAVEAKPGSAITVIQINRGDSTDGILGNLTQINANENSLVRLIQVQLLGKNSQSFDAVGARIGKGARVELIRAVLGGKTAACGSLALLESQEGIYEQKTAYFCEQEQIFDFNDIARHIGTRTESQMNTAGVLSGNSSKILRGTIDFKAGASHSVGHENETVLLLSPKARNRTVPLILCGEESVLGQHAASIGQFDEKQLYYLCSRGLSLIQAKRLLIESRFMPVLEQLPEELRAEILSAMERRLDDHEANL